VLFVRPQQTQQQQQIHHPAPQQSQAPEPARPIASPWMAQVQTHMPLLQEITVVPQV